MKTIHLKHRGQGPWHVSVMLIHPDNANEAAVVRAVRTCGDDRGEHAIDMQSVKATVTNV